MRKSSSIFKLITSKTSRLKTPQDALDYITDKQKTSDALTVAKFLQKKHLEKSWNAHLGTTKEKDRTFIHAIISPGGEVTKKKVLKLANDLMNLYSNFPTVATVHTDKPNHLHIHLLINPKDISTNKKWQQSRSAFYDILKAVNDKLTANGFEKLAHHLSDTDNEDITSSQTARRDVDSIEHKDKLFYYPRLCNTAIVAMHHQSLPVNYQEPEMKKQSESTNSKRFTNGVTNATIIRPK